VSCALRHSNDFAAAMNSTASAGGDNAGRAAMIGAWLGGALGIDALPHQWWEVLSAQEAIAACVECIVISCESRH